MSVRSRLAEPPAPAVKAFGGSVPAAIQAGEAASQMTPASAFSPGEPVGPYDGYSRTPRSREYVTGYNIATRPRTHERVSFETLKGLIDNYDVAQLCIRHRIASIRSLDWKLISAEGYDGDITDAIPVGMEALKRPDRKTLFKPWLAKWVRDILAYDAGTLVRMRNRGGRAVGLKVVSGLTIAPLLDYWGDSPDPPAPAYVQYVNGLPWNWLSRDDIIYEPYDPQPDSIYGKAPIEDVILNANTDIRFQVYFLQRFTEGNIPEAFASAPETWSPDQIEDFQEYWDGFMLGDQSRKSQIRWVPGGSSFAWSNEKDFTDTFSLFLMRKTSAAFSVVPTDLGFTENANLASGESQADVQHRVGDLPLAHHIQEILSAFLQDDLGLPLRFAFDLGEEQDDRLNQAQADEIYLQNGVVGASEIREMRFGLTEPEGQMVPRIILTERGGPIPLNSLMAVAGTIDPQTSAPSPGQPLPHNAFLPVEGVQPNPPLLTEPLAEQEYGPSALPPAPPPQPGTGPVAKEGATAGITSGTGITGYDGPGSDDGEDEDERRAVAVAKELAAFRRFERARRKAGTWRDFTFEAADPIRAHRLNDAGRLAVRKAAGEIAVAGLAVLAEDTGRVLMLQRALCDDDPAAGTWEFPGGHLEQGESPLQAAWREWAEETGAIPPPGQQAGSWTAGNGIYQGIVWQVPSEDCVPVRTETLVANPDDPDGDQAEAIAWWDPGDLPGNTAVRPELLADIDAVMAALGCGEDEPGDAGPVAKAGGGQDPKAPPLAWAGWRLTDKATAYWAPLVTSATTSALTPARLNSAAADYLAANPQQQGDAPQKRDRNEAAYAWLVAWLSAHGVTLDASGLASGILADGYLIGSVSAAAAAAGTAADLGGWKPGASAAALGRVRGLGGGTALVSYLTAQAASMAAEITGAVLGAISRALAGTDGDSDPGKLGSDLAGTVADSALGAGTVFGVLCGATAKAADDFYCGYGTSPPGLGLGDFAWVVDPTLMNCPICVTNAGADPRPYGDAWPSGDTSTGIHPRCGCALIPA